MSDYGQVLVLYQISNEFPAGGASVEAHYNAFYMPRKGGVTLSTVKRSCLALRQLNCRGPDGYHWRVRIDEKPNTSHSSNAPSSSCSSIAYSWWDIQDENARLPVKEATPSELKRMFAPPRSKTATEGDVTQEVTKAAKGAIKYMGKAMNVVAGGSSASNGIMHHDDDLNCVRTPVICFKLLDLVKTQRGLAGRGAGGAAGVTTDTRGRMPAQPSNMSGNRRRTASGSSLSQVSQQSSNAAHQQRPRVPAPVSAGAPRIPPPSSSSQQQSQPGRMPPSVTRSTPTANLMDFGAPAAPPARVLHHAISMPAMTSSRSTGAIATPTGALPNETRAEKLKREYAQKATKSNRVWDDVDQRWVEGPVKNGETTLPSPDDASNNVASPDASFSRNPSVTETTTQLKGISLSARNAIGKSAAVQAAVHARVAEMEHSQQKAIEELRIRESQKQQAEVEEESVRQRLEPKLKAWSEEHGKKKQLRALLANLHTILWEDSGWKPVSLADVLDESKVKRVYHKASRVVHPDKTGHLDAEKRFVAKRVFDALTQAKVEFDEGAK